MADKTKIEWTQSADGTPGATWNPIRGCSRVSEGCTNCYAERMAARFCDEGQPYHGLTKRTANGPRWTNEVRFVESALDQPLRWRKPRKIFVCSMSDLFHEKVPDEWIDKVFAVMALAPQHTFIVLTKRPERMRTWFSERWQGTPAQIIGGMHLPAGPETGRLERVADACEPILDDHGLSNPEDDSLWTPEGNCRAMQWPWPLPNVWLLVSVEDQKTADERIPLLLDTPAAVRGVSYEPALGPVDFRRWLFDWGCERCGYGGYQTDDHCPDCGWVGNAEEDSAPCPECGEPLTDYYACPECGATNYEGFGVTISGQRLDVLRWLVCGGESGPGARLAHPDWFRSARNQCAAAGVPFFMKQMSKRMPIPDDLMIRDFPA